MRLLKIGNVKIKNPLFLAPMVEVTDLPYRLLCQKAGCGMSYTEMLYLDAITHENHKTKKLMETSPKEKPIGIQVTGNTNNELEEAIKMGAFDKFDIVDINCGCPSVRITGNEAGSFLLKNPEKIVKMIKTLKDAGYTATAKIRLGFDNNNVMKVSKMIQEAGADALTVHARLATHSGKVPADWKWIEKVKKELSIPVIGNGDITNGESAKKMLETSDGAMIARAAIGDPYIFERVKYFLKTGKEKEFNVKKNIKAFKEYMKLCEKHDFKDLGRIKYVGGNFIRNFEGAAKLRSEFMQQKTFDDLKDFSKKL